MKVDMFVFLGISSFSPPEYIKEFLDLLKGDFAKGKVDCSFRLNNNLLTIKIEGFSYHIGLTQDKTDLKHWLQMAKDFELDTDKKLKYFNRIVNPGIIKKLFGFSVRDKHYKAIAPYIIKRMEEIKDIEIYCFY